MNNIFSRIVPFLIAIIFYPLTTIAQERPQSPEEKKYRSDAEILAGLEVYAANLDAAYVKMRDERDALKVRVAELEAALKAERESKNN